MKFEKVLCAGSFDLLHSGHLNYFSQARRIAKKIVVVVSSDENYFKARGKNPLHSQDERISFIKNANVVDEIVKGSSGNIFEVIKKINPDAILLGYDDKISEEVLEKNIKEMGLKIQILRAKAFNPEKYKSSLMKKD